MLQDRTDPGSVEPKLRGDVRAPGAVGHRSEDSQAVVGSLDGFKDMVAEGKAVVEVDSQVSGG